MSEFVRGYLSGSFLAFIIGFFVCRLVYRIHR